VSKKIKLILVGKNSFLSNILFKRLKKKIKIKKISLKDFYKIKKLPDYSHICNLATHPNYLNKKYSCKFDIDIRILNKIKKLNLKYIFISSRKVYKMKFNITEKDKLYPKDIYSSNKITTEKKLKKILKERLIILRVSNVLGEKIKNIKRVHKTFLDNYINYLKDNKVYYYCNDFKDFITEKMFADIFFLILKKNVFGTFNISLGKKIYIREILKWLNYENHQKQKFILNIKKKPKDSFTLNNNKIKKITRLRALKKDVEVFCKNLGKKIYFQNINSKI